LWAFAIGSRLTLALPIGLMALMVTGWVLCVNNHWSIKKILELISLGVPLVLGFAGLGWYNWARFGSVLESGYFYAMTSIPNLEEHYNQLFNPIFFLQNLYNYFLFPFSIRSQFPFFFAEYGNINAIFPSYQLPSFYFSQKITGLVFTVPFLVFAIIPSVTYFNNLLKQKKAQSSLDKGDERRILNWMTLTLSGAGLAVFSFLMAYYWAATRFLEDVMPSMIMVSIIGFWQGYQSLSNKPVGKTVYTTIGIILILISILISTLVALSINNARFVIVHLFSLAK
jgi:hypothetical protein